MIISPKKYNSSKNYFSFTFNLLIIFLVLLSFLFYDREDLESLGQILANVLTLNVVFARSSGS